jgi:retinol dehydrogenase-12
MALEGGELAAAVIFGILGVVLGIALLLFLFRLWMQGPKCRSKVKLDGKIAVITGANTGIGKICAMDFSRRGAKVVILCRSTERGEAAAEEIRKETKGEVIVHKMDLASLASVRACAEQLGNSLEKIDILLNNAGVMTCPEMRTEEGFEMQIGTNHFGHFLLTNLLMPLLKRGAPGARIVNVSSLAHEQGRMNFDDINFEKTPYNAITAYGQSKLANVLFTRELARKGEGSGVNAYSLHPGVINTDLGRHLKDTYGACAGAMLVCFAPLLKTPVAGAQTSLFCCLDESLAEKNGKYYSDCREKTPAPAARSDEDAKKLWELSEKLTNLHQV